MASRRSTKYADRRRKARNSKQQKNLQLESLEPKVLLAGNTSDSIAQVVSVVPQPITRAANGGLSQATDQIVVHFNDVDLLDSSSSAENPALYQLIHTNDTITNTDDTIHLPTSVSYDAATNRATLTFASDLSELHNDDAPYRLRINTSPDLPVAPVALDHVQDIAGSSFSTATSATGTGNAILSGAVVIDAAIDPQQFVLDFPGSDDEPGIRNLPLQPHLLDEKDSESGIATIPYNFKTFYGVDPSGNDLRNAITETQKDRAREIFDIYGTMFGVQFYETADEGLSIVTGDLRALQTTFQTSSQGGIIAASGSTNIFDEVPTAIMDLAEPWDDSFGGSWYQAAMREIGHLLGMGVTPEVSGANVLGNLTESLNPLVTRFQDFENFGYQLAVSPSAQTPGWVDTSTLQLRNSAINVKNGATTIRTSFVGLDPLDSTIEGTGDFGITAERILPGDATILLGQHLHRPDSVDVDLYRFRLNSLGRFSAETIAERLNDSSLLDTTLTLFDASGEVIARNDDYFSEDSLIDLELDAGTYFIGVSASGNQDFDPTIENTGLNGTSEGPYRLRLDFSPSSTENVLDTFGRALDGDGDGSPGGTFNFWFEANSADRTIYVDKSAGQGGDGSLGAPYNNIEQALDVCTGDDQTQCRVDDRDIARIVGNGGADGNVSTLGDNLAYELGFDNFGELPDGGALIVPRGMTVMIDEGAIFKMRRSFVQVGTSTTNVERSGTALQILGTPDADVIFTSREDEATGVDNEVLDTTPEPGEWGGIIFQNDLDRSNFKLDENGAPNDAEARGIFLNHVTNADIRYGGGNVTIDSVQEVINPIHLIDSRPTISFNDITFSADAAISANPDSFEESRFHAVDSLEVDYQAVPFTSDYDRIGPDIVGNFLQNNTTNALSVRIDTLAGDRLEELTVSGRFDDTDIVHVIKENLIIGSTPGGPIERPGGIGTKAARRDAQLVVDAGIVVKMDGTRIDTSISAQLIAEGTPDNPVVFTSINDDRFGGDTEAGIAATSGDWGGIYVGNSARLSLDNAVIAYAGGVTRIPGSSAAFNAVEIHQAEAARITNSTIEFSAQGVGGIGDVDRVGRGINGPGAIFVRGAQPIIVGNQITDTDGTLSAVINIDPNSLNSTRLPDYGTSRGELDRFIQFDDNQGPLVRGNVLDRNTLNGMLIREGVITTEVVWDDTDIVHVLFDQIVIPNHFSSGGLRLESSSTESLVVKLDGQHAGFIASGMPLEIDDRIGGILNIVGQPGHPVVLTSLADDSVGAGLDTTGRAQTDTDEGVFTRPLRTEEEGSFQIDINFGPFIRQHPDMVAGVERAARQWEKLFEDPITITIDIDLDSPDAEGNYTINEFALQEVYIAEPATTSVNFDEVVDGLADDSRPHESVARQIPSFDDIEVTFPNTPEDPFTVNESILVNTANYKAIFGEDIPDEAQVVSQFDSDEHADGTILLNEGSINFQHWSVGPEFFDADRSDGLQQGSMDFVGIVASAIGNVLGFRSGIEDVRIALQDANTSRDTQLTPLDLFRLEPGEGGDDFFNAPRALDPDLQSHVFYDGGIFDPAGLPNELRLQQGDIPLLADAIDTRTLQTNQFVTGYELPENLNGFYVGIGQPAYGIDFEYHITEQDKSVFDLIGYDVVGGPLSGDWEGVSFQTYSHDRNVAVITEFEGANDGSGTNNVTSTAQYLGTLAPEEKDSDENLRVGFEVHGFINNAASANLASDVDVYSFDATPGTEIWIDIDRTSQSLDTIVELVNANGVTEARSDNSYNESLEDDDPDYQQRFERPGIFSFSMNKSIFLSQDHYSTNPLDAGMRVVLPGEGVDRSTYHIRVRSAGLEADELGGGLTEGAYELQVRLGETDEVPGSSVQYADIRYATDGIRVSGLPRHSPLTGEVREDASPNDTLNAVSLTGTVAPDAFGQFNSNALRPLGVFIFDDDNTDVDIAIEGVDGGEFPAPQYVGNVLASDRGAITISGKLQPIVEPSQFATTTFESDVDYYMFSVDFEAVQTTGQFAAPTTANLIFDLDYADGLGRADTSIFIYEAEFPFDFQTEFDVQVGPLIASSTDSGDLDDLPAPGQPTGLEDLSRGSVGRLDPLLGPFEIAEGQYILAVMSSNVIVKEVDEQFTEHLPYNPLVRAEPIDVLGRVADETFDGPVFPEPELPVLIDTNSIVPFNLSDVTLYVSQPDGAGAVLYTVDPFQGGIETQVGALGLPPDPDGNNQGGGGQGDLADVYNVGDFVLGERQFVPGVDLGPVEEQFFAFTLGDTEANTGNYLVIEPSDATVRGSGTGDNNNQGGGNNQQFVQDETFTDDGIDGYGVDLAADPPEINDDIDDGVQFEALALLQAGRRNYTGYAVGNRSDPAIMNVLYQYDHSNGLAQDSEALREDDADRLPPAGSEDNFGYSNVVERGVLFTEMDLGGNGGAIIPNENTALIATAAVEDNQVLIPDGMRITTLEVVDPDDPTLDVQTTYEIDTVPGGVIQVDPANGVVPRDGDEFFIGDDVYEVETGPVLVLNEELSSFSAGDQIVISDIRSEEPALFIEIVQNDPPTTPGAIPLSIGVGDSAELAQNLVDLINDHPGSATAHLDGLRVNLQYEGDVAINSSAMQIDGALGADGNGILISMEEFFTSEQIVDVFLSSIPGAIADGNLVGFTEADEVEFFDFEPAAQINAEAGVSGSNVRIPILPTFTGQQVAEAIATAVGGTAAGNVITLEQGTSMQFQSAGDLEISGQSPGGKITGLQFVGGTLYGVSDAGGLFIVRSHGVPQGAYVDYLESSAELEGISFSGLTLGPQEVAGGIYSEMFFATDTAGNIHAFDFNGSPQPIFVNGATSVPTGIGNANGLEFSSLQENLWGTTVERAADPGHGELFFGGGNSLRFGDADRSFDFPGGAAGTVLSNEIDLSEYTADDLPTLYFNYFLTAEESELLDDPQFKRDAFRVYISDDDAEVDRGLWQLVAASDQALPDGVEPLFTNSFYDIPRFTRDTSFFENIDDLPDSQEDLPLGPSGDRDTFPFQGEVEFDNNTPRNPFPENSNIGDPNDEDWDDHTGLDERNSVWRQARIDLAQFAGSSSLRLRFDFSTAASFDIGGFGGVELKAVDAAELSDGDTMTIAGVTFEVDLGLSILASAGTSLRDGETVFVLDNEGVGHRFEFDNDDTVAEGNIAVPFTPTQSASSVAFSLATAMDSVGLSGSVDGNRLSVDADNAFTSEGSLIRVEGGGVDAGVAPGNVAVNLTRDMTSAQVAGALKGLLAETFAGGNAAAFSGTNNVIRVYGLSVEDPGPFGVTTELLGDAWGSFTNQAGTPAYRGLENEFRYYDIDEDDEQDPAVLDPSLLEVDANGNVTNQPVDFLVPFEGAYIDDIVIGFRSRGELLVDHRESLNHQFDLDWQELTYERDDRVRNLFAAGTSEFEVDFLSSAIAVGEYQVEIRVATPDDVSLNQLERTVPNATLLAPSGALVFDGKFFELNDGRQTVTFEYNDLALGTPGDVGGDNVAIDYNTSDTTFELAAKIRDAINSVGSLRLTATTGDGAVTAGVVSTESNRINLIGNAVVPELDLPNGIEFITSSFEASGNRERDQGQLIITQSRVTHSEGHGIIVEDSLRDLPSYEWADPFGREVHSQFSEGDYTPQPGPVRNLREINQENLTTGVVISNNVVAFNDEGGIKYGGDPDGYVFVAPFGDDPPAANLEAWDQLKFTITDNNNLSRTFEFHDLEINAPAVPGTDYVLGNVPIFFNRDNYFNNPIDCVYANAPGDCEGRYTPSDTDMADRLQEAIERSNLDVTVYRGKGHELFIEGASFIGLRPNDIPSFAVESFVSRVQTGAVPFGRIVNNTVVGRGGEFTDTRIDEVDSIDPSQTDDVLRVVNDYQDIGIEIGDNSDPTLLNNVVVNFEVGVQADFTAIDSVREGLVFQGNNRDTENTTIGDFASILRLTDPLFVDLANGNFYPAAGASIIDSSIDSLEERPSLSSVKSPLGIAPSPILAPDRDALGQLREDDPSFEPQDGQGRNAFKDRGAIDRVDFVGPSARLQVPLDNDSLGIDKNPATTVVSLDPENVVDSFDIVFPDSSQIGGAADGTGLDPFSITENSLAVTRNGVALTPGVDFEIDLDATNGILRLIPTGGTWSIGSTYVITLNENLVQDIAGNSIQGNQPDGSVTFTVSILLGTDFGDAPIGYPVASHDIIDGFHLGTSVTPEPESQPSPGATADTGDNGVRLPEEFERNASNGITVTASADGVLDAWFDFNMDGDWNDAGERVFSGTPISGGANELNVDVPFDAATGEIFARFRFSSDGVAGVAGNATDGEVEDYAVFVDFGNVWQNINNPLDVNGDGTVSAIDVLRIIQEIRNPQASDPDTSELIIPPVEPNTPESIGFVDVNGNGFVSALDALIIITAINEGSAEPALAALAAPVTVDPIGDILEQPAVELPQGEPLSPSIDDDLALAIAAQQSSNDVDDAFADLDWINDSDV